MPRSTNLLSSCSSFILVFHVKSFSSRPPLPYQAAPLSAVFSLKPSLSPVDTSTPAGIKEFFVCLLGIYREGDQLEQWASGGYHLYSIYITPVGPSSTFFNSLQQPLENIGMNVSAYPQIHY